MGLQDGHCDSCSEETSFLFPLAVLVELPTGGEGMVVRYYCYDCYDILEDTAIEEKKDKEDEELEDEDVEPDKDTKCKCCGDSIEVGEGHLITEYFCFGCSSFICSRCCIAYEGMGMHTIQDHRMACKEKGVHS